MQVATASICRYDDLGESPGPDNVRSTMLDQESPFSQSALSTNQSGRLTDEQSQRWARIAKGRRQGVRGVAYVFGAMSALLLFFPGSAAKAAARTNGGVVFLAATAILLVGANLEPVNADVREGRVESVEGAIAKRLRQSRGPGGGSWFYYLDVGGRRLRATSREAFDAAPAAGYVRVYFLPRSGRVINLEQLADPPIPTGSGAAQEIFQDFAHALRSRDRTAIAEASAHVAALKHTFEGPPPHPSSDGSDRASSSRLRADDLYGTWTNPMVTVTFRKNGIATMTPAFGAESRDGHWSVDANGRLLTDASGTMEPVEAFFEGKQLTIVIDGQRVAFTRT